VALIQRGVTTLIFDRATPAVIDLSGRLPGKRRWKDGKLFVDATGANIQAILETFPTASELGLPAIDDYLGARQAGQAVRLQKASELPPEASAFPFKTQPFHHQRKAFAISRNSEFFAYFMEMGTGKSKLAVDVTGSLAIQGHVDTMFILAPNGVHRQWVEQAIPQHMTSEVEWRGFAHRSSMRARDKTRLDEVTRFKAGLRVFAFATESLSSASAQELLADLVAMFGKRAILIVDESHQYANAKSKRSEFVHAIAPSCAYRRILTGSPITDGIENLFSQIKILSPTIFGHRSQTSFNREFCQLEQIYGAPRGAMRIRGYQNLKRLSDMLEGVSFRVTKDECLDLPEKVYSIVQVEWDKEQLRIYREMKRAMAAELSSGVEITAPLAISKMTKLQQILGGFVFDNEKIAHPVPSNKIKALLNISEQNPGGGIVWCRYLPEIRLVEKALREAGYRVGVHVGATSAEERQRITERSQVDWLVANESASTGLDMPWWSLAVYYSNTFNAAVRWQSEDRIHRIGQKNRCTYVDLVVPNSLDEVIAEALRTKRTIADHVWVPEHLLKDTLKLEEDE